jgi:uncharacterized protein (TIGR00251 family)
VIQVVDHAEGCILPVRAQPGARRTGIVGEHGGALKIGVNAPPDKGKANDALQELLCQTLGLRRSQVELISGLTHRDKRFLLRGLSAGDLLQKLGGAQP